MYDGGANLTKKSKSASQETSVYTYDHRNQMVSFRLYDKDPDLNPDETLLKEAGYEYDVFGNRIKKQVDNDGNSTIDFENHYSLDGWKPGSGFIGNENWDVIFDMDSNNAVQNRYLRGDIIDQLFARIESTGNAFWLLTDRLGSVRDVTDNTGVVKDTIAYDGYGNITSESDPLYGGRYKFTSREYDAETELLYYRARYYNAATGRWTSQDPLGFDAGDSNLYRYVHNRPTIGGDPSGLIEILFFGRGAERNDKKGILQRITDKREAVNPPISVYWFSPPNVKIDANINPMIDKALKVIKAEIAKCPNEPVNIYGYSRGGGLALILAKKLQNENIDVDFLGLIDPSTAGLLVDDFIFIYPKENQYPKGDRRRAELPRFHALIPNNVLRSFVALSKGEATGNVFDGSLFTNILKLKAENQNNPNIKFKEYPQFGHLGLGSSPTVEKDLEDAFFGNP